MHLELLDTHASSWPQTLASLYPSLGGEQNETLFPLHFLQAAFPHIGGRAVRVLTGGEIVMILFLLPHPPREDDETVRANWTGQPAYTARAHRVNDAKVSSPDPVPLQQALVQLLGTPAIVLYDPSADHAFRGTGRAVGALDIGRPDQTEAAMIRTLQQSIWGSPPGSLYPVDIHSTDFPVGTSLVARVDGAVAGFLFGFYKAGGPALPGDWHERWQGDLRLESQVMGVLPAHRGLRIGYLLKRVQAETALAQGIGIVHWTVDPLQYPNAALNFGLLRALAFTFTPNYYPFRNELNRAPASRFSLTWLIDSARVQSKPLYDARSTILQLDQHPAVVRVNRGWQQLDFAATAPMIAVEIPANWTALQQQAPDEALEWRSATDRLFAHYIGSQNDQYVVTDVGVTAEQRFLILQRVSDSLWQRLEGAQQPDPVRDRADHTA